MGFGGGGGVGIFIGKMREWEASIGVPWYTNDNSILICHVICLVSIFFFVFFIFYFYYIYISGLIFARQFGGLSKLRSLQILHV